MSQIAANLFSTPPLLLALIAPIGCKYQEPGFQVKNGCSVYVVAEPGSMGSVHSTRVVDADPGSFQPVPALAGAPKNALPYARDKSKVFVGVLMLPFQLEGCDPASFAILQPDGVYARDDANVYYCGLKLPNADPATFQVLEKPYAKDKGQVYAGAVVMEVANPAAFEVVLKGYSDMPLSTRGIVIIPRNQEEVKQSVGGWARDGVNYYGGLSAVPLADYATFKVLNSCYGKDQDHVYYCRHGGVTFVRNADAASFEIKSQGSAARGQDKFGEYFRGERVVADP